MSRRRSTGKSVEKERKAAALYAYCIGDAKELGSFVDEGPEAIEPGTRVELISRGDLAAVVSTVPMSDYAEEALESRLADPEWTAVRAIRHQRVVEFFAGRAGVVPLRFGAIFFKPIGVQKMLDERREELRAIIERLRGREEWGVNVFRDRSLLLKAITSLSPRLRELETRAASASAGQAYLLRKEIESSLADEARVESKRVVAAIERGLASASDAQTSLGLLKPDQSAPTDLIARFAFLVSRDRFAEFRAAAEQHAAEHGESGFQIEMTGPWPAYNFASGQQ